MRTKDLDYVGPGIVGYGYKDIDITKILPQYMSMKKNNGLAAEAMYVGKPVIVAGTIRYIHKNKYFNKSIEVLVDITQMSGYSDRKMRGRKFARCYFDINNLENVAQLRDGNRCLATIEGSFVDDHCYDEDALINPMAEDEVNVNNCKVVQVAFLGRKPSDTLTSSTPLPITKAYPCVKNLCRSNIIAAEVECINTQVSVTGKVLKIYRNDKKEPTILLDISNMPKFDLLKMGYCKQAECSFSSGTAIDEILEVTTGDTITIFGNMSVESVYRGSQGIKDPIDVLDCKLKSSGGKSNGSQTKQI